MDKFGDYIPLIIIALSFIYSLAKRAGKNVAKKEAEKTMLPGGIPQRKVPTSQSKPAPIQKKTSSQVFPARENRETRKSFLDDSQVVSLETMSDDAFKAEMADRTEKQILVEEDIEPVIFDFNSSDELKKGIVYAEIFNRKY